MPTTVSLCFLLMVPIGYVSYRFVESPFLKLRTRYIVPRPPPESPPAGAAEVCETRGSGTRP